MMLAEAEAASREQVSTAEERVKAAERDALEALEQVETDFRV